MGNLSQARQAKADKVLDTLVNYSDYGVKTRRQFLELMHKTGGTATDPTKFNGLQFVPAGARIENNTYFYSWTNTSGQALNINNFTVSFGDLTCTYTTQPNKPAKKSSKKLQ